MTEETTQAFLKRLWELQLDQKISNAELARRIGISPSYVRRLKIRTNIRSIGFWIALAAVREFPELAPFLSSELRTSNPILADAPEAAEGEQGQ